MDGQIGGKKYIYIYNRLLKYLFIRLQYKRQANDNETNSKRLDRLPAGYTLITNTSYTTIGTRTRHKID